MFTAVVEVDFLFLFPAVNFSGVMNVIGGVAGAIGRISYCVLPRDTWEGAEASTVVAIIVMTQNSSGGNTDTRWKREH